MIELLMVIVLVSILSAVALPQFLDFRREARVAAARIILTSLRTGLSNQIMQARLKCGLTDIDYADFLNAMSSNDITYNNEICTTAQIPLAADRKFIDVTGSTLIQEVGGSPIFPPSIPSNPLFEEEGDHPYIAAFLVTSGIAPTCITTPWLDGEDAFHWTFFLDTGEIDTAFCF